MHLGFTLDLWDIDLLDTDLHLLVGHGLIHISQLTFCLPPRRLKDVFKICLQDVISLASFHLPRGLQDVFKTSWERLANTSWRHLEDVLKTSCQAEDVLKTSSRHVLKTFWRSLEDQQMFAGLRLRTLGD